ncbi:MAG: hypothetical protein D6766_07820 [Verrucomicrobia bacterium]|nr:MAG: hypothetical protein D6766_07820 [Verrucomicrobiota bacterium]
MGAIPPSLTTLSVAWIFGRFEAVAITRGSVTGSWTAPEPVKEPGQFGAAVKKAALETGYHGSTVHLVLAHPKLSATHISTPAARGSSLERLLEREAEKEKTFDGPAAWCYQPTPTSKSGPGVLLHLFPAQMLDQLTRAVERSAGLTLVAAVPATAVLHAQILGLQVPLTDAIMVLANTGENSLMLVAQREGPVLLARSVPATWDKNLSGLLADLNRTVLYVNEQFGVELAAIFLFGNGAVEHQAALQAPFEIPVRPSMAEDAPGYWATEVLRVPPALAPNLVSPEQQRAPQRRALLKVVASLTVLLVVGALGVFAWSQFYLRSLRRDIARLEEQRTQLRDRHRELSESFAELLGKRALRAEVIEGRVDPLPVWTLAYLSEVVPPELQLDHFNMSREGELWRLTLEGRLLPTTNTAPDLLLASLVSSLTNRLGQPPLNMQVLSAGAKRQARSTASPATLNVLSRWAQRLNMPVTNLVASGDFRFQVEGRVR